MLWEAYFQELPEEDFNPDNMPRWKRNSLDTNRHIFFSQNKISIMAAVGSVFNEDNIGRPVWNKRYLNAYQQWVTEFPNINHKSVLISVAKSMGIEQIRYHASTQMFYSPDKCYILIREYSIMPSAEITQSLNESVNYKTTNQNDSTELTIEEITDLIRGINFIGKSKWKEILENPGLKFSPIRNETSLRKGFLKLEKRLKIIYFGGKYYQVLPGFEIECIEPMPLVEQVNIENSSNCNLCSSGTCKNNEKVEPPAKKIKTSKIYGKRNVSSDDFCHTQIQKDPNSETPEQVQKLEESIDFDKDHTFIFNICYPPDGNKDEFESSDNPTTNEVVKVNIEQILNIFNDIYQDEIAGSADETKIDHTNGSIYKYNHHEIMNRITKPEDSYAITNNSDSTLNLVHDPLLAITDNFLENSTSSFEPVAGSQSTDPSSSASVHSIAKPEMKTLPVQSSKGIPTTSAKKPASVSPEVASSSVKRRVQSTVKSSNKFLSVADQRVVEIINEVYQETNANCLFFLSLLLMFPQDFDAEKKITWSFIYRNHMRGNLRNVEKWNILKRRLIEENFIEESSNKLIKRHF